MTKNPANNNPMINSSIELAAIRNTRYKTSHNLTANKWLNTCEWLEVLEMNKNSRRSSSRVLSKATVREEKPRLKKKNLRKTWAKVSLGIIQKSVIDHRQGKIFLKMKQSGLLEKAFSSETTLIKVSAATG